MISNSEIKEILSKTKLSEQDLKTLEEFEPNDGTNRLYSFFTPVWLCQVIYDLAKKHGFNPATGRILEPAAGTGNFLAVLDNPKLATAFELDPLNYEVSKKRVPEATIYNQYFETAFLEPTRYTTKLKNKVSWLGEFDLVIGNPPYGKYKNQYSGYFSSLKIKQIELFFMLQSMKLLKKDEYMASNTPAVDSNKKLQLAKAKSKAIQIRLRLINQKN